jgi:putative membrane-bound dehydrogenase-like protein
VGRPFAATPAGARSLVRVHRLPVDVMKHFASAIIRTLGGEWMTPLRLTAISIAAILGAGSASLRLVGQPQRTSTAPRLTIRQDVRAGTISVYRAGQRAPIVQQNARPDERPYLHPIAAPDGAGVATEASPSHHPHQTGLYWGFTRLNGRDYFHNRAGDYWRRVSAAVVPSKDGEDDGAVRWQTVYDLLDEKGSPVLTETERWSMRDERGTFVLDLEWRGRAHRDVTIGKYDYGGLFLRMPWKAGIEGEVVNAARERGARAEGRRATWIDVAMKVDGRKDLLHVAMFDHPDNANYPQAWRVDDQLGVGSARTREADWKIASGDTEVIRHQFVIYTGELNDIEIANAWNAFTGNRSTTALWTVAQREGRLAKFLTPDQAVAQMTTIDGYRVNAWAGEPMLVQPMAFCWDDRGRLWVAENRDYESRVGGFSNAGNSRILILEDTNRDGVADSRKVFMEGIVFPAAIAVGFDGVFVGAPPNLLFIPDRDRDDKADVADIEVRLTGWGIRDRHETLNSLHWGPDGWLYGLQGFATESRVRKPQGKGRLYKHREPFPDDVPGREGIPINGGVWRYHPTKDVFEVVAHGFSNPWGIDYDSKGQLLISACVIPHLFHVIPGGIYHRQGGQHFNPYVYADLQTIADHRHRSAHGGARVYQSDAFPSSQLGRIFMANIHEHAVLSDVLERKGSGFTARHGDDFMLANNAQWIGFSLEIGPEGDLYVLDWHDADICGMEVINQETGRIFRIAPVKSLAADWPDRYADLRTLTDARLVELQTSVSDWHARRARLILQHRAASGALKSDTHDALRRLVTSTTNADWRLRALWALHVTGGWSKDALIGLLTDKDEHVRAWAVQLLAEDRQPGPRALDVFQTMARDDQSPVVRLYLASALQRLDPSARWPIASGLIARREDNADHNLPTMVWLGVEPLVAENPAMALDRASNAGMPSIARFIARRLVDADALDPLVAAIAKQPPAEVSLLEGMRDGLQGRYDVAAPSSWQPVLARLKRSDPKLASLAADISQQFGDTEATLRNVAIVRDKAAPIDDRRRALQLLAAGRRPQLAAEIPAVLAEEPLRVDSIRAIAAFDDDALGRLLISKYASFNSAEKREAIQTLASRGRYGRMLTDALASDTVPRRDIPPHLARQLRRVVGTRFADVYGPVETDATAAKLERSYAKYRALLTDDALSAANVSKGRTTFQQTCGACHRLYGQGGQIGPDLTGSNRANLDYLLSNVLNPNADVAEAYKMVMIVTRDGRTLAGNVVAETDRQVTLRMVGRDNVAVNKSDIQSREATSASMMPPGLFDGLSDREVVDLVGFLRSVEPGKSR